MVTVLYFQNHTFSFLVETLVKKQSMMSGALVLKKLPSLGLNLIAVEKLLK
jgi:hypothetical protein